jgi:hypothetical protein
MDNAGIQQHADHWLINNDLEILSQYYATDFCMWIDELRKDICAQNT